METALTTTIISVAGGATGGLITLVLKPVFDKHIFRSNAFFQSRAEIIKELYSKLIEIEDKIEVVIQLEMILKFKSYEEIRENEIIKKKLDFILQSFNDYRKISSEVFIYYKKNRIHFDDETKKNIEKVLTAFKYGFTLSVEIPKEPDIKEWDKKFFEINQYIVTTVLETTQEIKKLLTILEQKFRKDLGF